MNPADPATAPPNIPLPILVPFAAAKPPPTPAPTPIAIKAGVAVPAVTTDIAKHRQQ